LCSTVNPEGIAGADDEEQGNELPCLVSGDDTTLEVGHGLPDEPRFKAVWGETVPHIVRLVPAALLVREPQAAPETTEP